MTQPARTPLSPSARRTLTLLGGVVAIGLGWLGAEVIIPWWEARQMQDSLASHAWSMASLEPGGTYTLASFPVPPGKGDPPQFTATLNQRGVRERDFDERPPVGVTRVIAIGDSTTFGTGVPANARFTGQLQRWLDHQHPGRVEVLNCGKAGMTAAAGRQFYESQVRVWNPEVLIVGLGTNDLRDGTDPMRVTEDASALDRYQTELESLARIAAQDGVKVIFWANAVLDGRGEDTLGPFRARMELVGEKYARPVVSVAALYARSPASAAEQATFKAGQPWTDYWPEFSRVPLERAALYNDMAHPNAAGFRRLATALAPLVLRAAGLTPRKD